MTVRKNPSNHTLLRTGLPVFLLILLFYFVPGLVWADCEGIIFRKYIDKKYSGIKAIVIAKVGPVVNTRPAMMILDGRNESWHYDGETRTYQFSVLKPVMGDVSGMLKVEETYWDTLNGGNVDPKKHGANIFARGKNYLLFLRSGGASEFEVAGCGPPENAEETKWKMFFLDVYFQKLSDDDTNKKIWRELSLLIPSVKSEEEKYGSGNIPRDQALKALLQIMDREVERIPRYPLKIMTEILGLLAERNELSGKVLFKHFIAVKEQLKTYSESEVKLRQRWTLLLASDLAWFRKESINKVLIPYLAEELKGPYSVRAEFTLRNIGTIDAIDEIRKHYIDN
jgi:hypothetical protein